MRIPLSTLTFRHPPLREQSCSAEEASYDDSEEKQGASSAARSRRRVAGERCPSYPNQEDVNDLIREMALTKSSAEMLVFQTEAVGLV